MRYRGSNHTNSGMGQPGTRPKQSSGPQMIRFTMPVANPIPQPGQPVRTPQQTAQPGQRTGQRNQNPQQNRKKQGQKRRSQPLSKQTARPNGSSGAATVRQDPPRTQTHPAQERNPQKPGYPQGRAHRTHRLTNVERQRIRRRRAFFSGLAVVIIVGLGIILSMSLLLKVTGCKVQNLDRTTPADTGVYTEEQILELLGVQQGENILSISTKEKSAQLAAQLPYLETVEVSIRLPGTVVVRVKPAKEQFRMQTDSGWAVLSDRLKVLRMESAEPVGLTRLVAETGESGQLLPGQTVSLRYRVALLPQNGDEGSNAAPEDVSAELQELVDALSEIGLLDEVTELRFEDFAELAFVYQDRVTVQLGTLNNLDYKLKLAANQLFNEDGKGISQKERGTLDVSYQREDGDIWAYFATEAEPTPTPEPTPEPENNEDSNENSEENGNAQD